MDSPRGEPRSGRPRNSKDKIVFWKAGLLPESSPDLAPSSSSWCRARCMACRMVWQNCRTVRPCHSSDSHRMRLGMALVRTELREDPSEAATLRARNGNSTTPRLRVGVWSPDSGPRNPGPRIGTPPTSRKRIESSECEAEPPASHCPVPSTPKLTKAASPSASAPVLVIGAKGTAALLGGVYHGAAAIAGAWRESSAKKATAAEHRWRNTHRCLRRRRAATPAGARYPHTRSRRHRRCRF